MTTSPGKSRTLIAASIGNVLEWYDFSIYGYFAATIGRVFFPDNSPTTQVLAAFGVFAAGFLMRPLGGVVVGHIGDRLGRRAALTFSIVAMALPTFLVGILPGYQTLGLAAPVLLTLLRMVQGLSVGGEATTAFICLAEQAPPERRGLLGAMASCAACLGMLMGSATGEAFSLLLSPQALADWGWRVPFLFGLAVGAFGFYLRHGMADTPAAERSARSPLVETVRHHPALLGRLAGFAAFNAVGFYLVFLYIASWLQLVDGVAPAHALGVTTVALVVLLPLMIGAGWLSDRVGRKGPLLAAAGLCFLAAVPLLGLMQNDNMALVLLGQLGFVLLVSVPLGIQPAFMVEATPVHIRCTAIALGYNASFGVIGGLTPLVATWLIQRTGDEISPAFLLMAAAAISFGSILLFRESAPAAMRAQLPAH
jgi:MHS family proline/betaine transporter-like MFS transporter